MFFLRNQRDQKGRKYKFCDYTQCHAIVLKQTLKLIGAYNSTFLLQEYANRPHTNPDRFLISVLLNTKHHVGAWIVAKVYDVLIWHWRPRRQLKAAYSRDKFDFVPGKAEILDHSGNSRAFT